MARLIRNGAFLGRELAKEWGLTLNYFESAKLRQYLCGTWYYNFECEIIDGLAFVKFDDEITALILNKSFVGVRLNARANTAEFFKIINLSDDIKIGFYRV